MTQFINKTNTDKIGVKKETIFYKIISTRDMSSICTASDIPKDFKFVELILRKEHSGYEYDVFYAHNGDNDGLIFFGIAGDEFE